MPDIDEGDLENSLINLVRANKYDDVLDSQQAHQLQPTEALLLPSKQETREFLERQPTGRFSFDNTTMEPAGFWLFVKFVTKLDPVAIERMRFLEAVVKFRHSERREEKAEQARLIWNEFLRGSGPELRCFGEADEDEKERRKRRGRRRGDYKPKEGIAASFDSQMYKSTIHRGFDIDLPALEEDFGDGSEALRKVIDASMAEATELVCKKKEGKKRRKKDPAGDGCDDDGESNDDGGRSSVMVSSAKAGRMEHSSSMMQKLSNRSAQHSSKGRSFNMVRDSIIDNSGRLVSRRRSWSQRALTDAPGGGGAEGHRSLAATGEAALEQLGAPITANLVNVTEPPTMVALVHYQLERELSALHDACDEADDDERLVADEPRGFLGSSLFDSATEVVLRGLEDATEAFRSSPEFEQLLALCVLEEQCKPCEAQYQVLRILGRGGFGSVYAAKNKKSGVCFAAKFMSKAAVAARGAETLCWNERDALALSHSPFVVSLKYAFQTKLDLVLVLDLLTGGDLRFHLSNTKHGRFALKEARFFAAEAVLALEHLHALGFVYRDLKLDNLLLTAEGHCKLSDLGLVAEYTPTLAGHAGTVGFMSAEMFRRDEEGRYDPTGRYGRYGYSTDWWSLGACLYKMLSGESPFTSKAAWAWAEGDEHTRNMIALSERTSPNKKTKKKKKGKRLKRETISRCAACAMDVEYPPAVLL